MFILRFFFYKNKNKNIKKKTSRTLDDVIPAKSKQYSSGGFCIIHRLCLYSCYDNTFETGREHQTAEVLAHKFQIMFGNLFLPLSEVPILSS